MIRRFLALLLSIALMPFAIPSGAYGGLAGRRHGTAAERSTSHGPIASLTESMTVRGGPARSSLRQENARPPAVGRRMFLPGDRSSRGASHPGRALLQGAALVPLRV
jgi:hypothetical protein